MTGDRDLFQLVRDDQPVRVIYSVEQLRARSTRPRWRASTPSPGAGYGEFAVLRGDPSDGLPGVPGIGAKTAAALVDRFGSVEAMLDGAGRAAQDAGFPAGARTKLETLPRLHRRRPLVVRVRTDVPLPELDLDAARANRPTRPRWSSSPSAGAWTPPLNRLLSALARLTSVGRLPAGPQHLG